MLSIAVTHKSYGSNKVWMEKLFHVHSIHTLIRYLSDCSLISEKNALKKLNMFECHIHCFIVWSPLFSIPYYGALIVFLSHKVKSRIDVMPDNFFAKFGIIDLFDSSYDLREARVWFAWGTASAHDFSHHSLRRFSFFPIFFDRYPVFTNIKCYHVCEQTISPRW